MGKYFRNTRLGLLLVTGLVLGVYAPTSKAIAQDQVVQKQSVRLANSQGISPKKTKNHKETIKAKRPNIIYILTDDQRYDEFGKMNPILDTPNMDRLANEGVHFKNAFVTTSLCSPSRATILTGQYMHTHGIVDNNTAFREGTKFFPEYLQKAGYATAFIGKWHMGGHSDAPQPGFDHWVSFAGQGHYLPVEHGKQNVLNVDGKHVNQKGYITGELTDYAMDWLKNGREKDKPFFLYLSHKAVHSNFTPEDKHKTRYAGVKIPVPASQANTPKNYKNKPMWVKNQRNSWHGVDFPYHSDLNVQEYKRRYHRALASVDDSIGVMLKYLKDEGLLDNTVVMLMGDNGFMFGEHGLIDKRNAYEESMRVPLLVFGPGVVEKGKVVDEVVANLDIAPTILDLAGVERPPQFEGKSFVPLAEGKPLPKGEKWRDNFVYEYYWEYNYPHTPSTFAIRGDRYKYIQYYGVWDTEELYDLKNDPKEMNNLIENPKYVGVVADLRHKLYEKLTNRDGEHKIGYSERIGFGAVLRNRNGAKAAEFPEFWLRNPEDKDLKRHVKNEGGRYKKER